MRISVEEARRLGVVLEDASPDAARSRRIRARGGSSRSDKLAAAQRGSRKVRSAASSRGEVRVGETIEVVVDGPHVPKERGRSGRTGSGRTVVYTSSRTRKYEAMVAGLGAVAMRGRAPIEGPVLVEISGTLPTPKSWPETLKRAARAGLVAPTARPDLDNSEKSALDALNDVVYRDDAVISRKLSEKSYGASRRLVIRVTRLAAIGSSEWRLMKAGPRRALLARIEAILAGMAGPETLRG